MINTDTILPFSINFNLLSYIDSGVLTIILGLFFVVYLIVSVALYYHWSKYGMSHPGVILAQSVFALGSVILFTVAVLSINYY